MSSFKPSLDWLQCQWFQQDGVLPGTVLSRVYVWVLSSLVFFFSFLFFFVFSFLFYKLAKLPSFQGTVYDSLIQMIALICHSLWICLWSTTQRSPWFPMSSQSLSFQWAALWLIDYHLLNQFLNYLNCFLMYLHLQLMRNWLELGSMRLKIKSNYTFI